MYVRWKKRKLKGKWGGPVPALDAVLVESYREDGKVKQRFIKHLGTISQMEQVGKRRSFHERVSKNLDSLELSPSGRAKIEAAISRKVPRPTEAELEAYDKQVRGLKDAVRRSDHKFLPV